MKLGKRRKFGDAHVRLYGYELASLAYRTLSTDARALLIEFRSLYSGGRNEVFLSVRQMQERVGIGQRRAQHARNELVERGWVRVLEQGAFHRKTKAATVYALTNEPLTDADGAVPPKDFMRWQPERKITVAEMTTDGSQDSYRGRSAPPSKPPNSSCHDYRKPELRQITVAATATQILLPRGCGDDGCKPETDSAAANLVAAP